MVSGDLATASEALDSYRDSLVTAEARMAQDRDKMAQLQDALRRLQSQMIAPGADMYSNFRLMHFLHVSMLQPIHLLIGSPISRRCGDRLAPGRAARRHAARVAAAHERRGGRCRRDGGRRVARALPLLPLVAVAPQDRALAAGPHEQRRRAGMA